MTAEMCNYSYVSGGYSQDSSTSFPGSSPFLAREWTLVASGHVSLGRGSKVYSCRFLRKDRGEASCEVYDNKWFDGEFVCTCLNK